MTNPCSTHPCLNNGTCFDDANSAGMNLKLINALDFRCFCPIGYSGIVCESKMKKLFSLTHIGTSKRLSWEWIPHIGLLPRVIPLKVIYRHGTQFFRGCYSCLAWIFSWRICFCFLSFLWGCVLWYFNIKRAITVREIPNRISKTASKFQNVWLS